MKKFGICNMVMERRDNIIFPESYLFLNIKEIQKLGQKRIELTSIKNLIIKIFFDFRHQLTNDTKMLICLIYLTHFNFTTDFEMLSQSPYCISQIKLDYYEGLCTINYSNCYQNDNWLCKLPNAFKKLISGQKYSKYFPLEMAIEFALLENNKYCRNALELYIQNNLDDEILNGDEGVVNDIMILFDLSDYFYFGIRKLKSMMRNSVSSDVMDRWKCLDLIIHFAIEDSKTFSDKIITEEVITLL